ncbi:hypothetical protein EVAR_5194_1 [Eumeta japonica]|uniref:Secreted protein n=1 Tax=Eumeta variegata TaxID=151549 RepID=A0A4C1V382_EUMVA|nr:hypothetical protein EVAR_5194_1 [Eumeta japonica]
MILMHALFFFSCLVLSERRGRQSTRRSPVLVDEPSLPAGGSDLEPVFPDAELALKSPRARCSSQEAEKLRFSEK